MKTPSTPKRDHSGLQSPNEFGDHFHSDQYPGTPGFVSGDSHSDFESDSDINNSEALSTKANQHDVGTKPHAPNPKPQIPNIALSKNQHKPISKTCRDKHIKVVSSRSEKFPAEIVSDNLPKNLTQRLNSDSGQKPGDHQGLGFIRQPRRRSGFHLDSAHDSNLLEKTDYFSFEASDVIRSLKMFQKFKKDSRRGGRFFNSAEFDQLEHTMKKVTNLIDTFENNQKYLLESNDEETARRAAELRSQTTSEVADSNGRTLRSKETNELTSERNLEIKRDGLEPASIMFAKKRKSGRRNAVILESQQLNRFREFEDANAPQQAENDEQTKSEVDESPLRGTNKKLQFCSNEEFLNIQESEMEEIIAMLDKNQENLKL